MRAFALERLPSNCTPDTTHQVHQPSNAVISAVSSIVSHRHSAESALHIRTKATPTATSKLNPEIGHWFAAALLSIHELDVMGEGILLVVDALPREVVPLGKVEAVPLRKGDVVLLMELWCARCGVSEWFVLRRRVLVWCGWGLTVRVSWRRGGRGE